MLNWFNWLSNKPNWIRKRNWFSLKTKLLNDTFNAPLMRCHTFRYVDTIFLPRSVSLTQFPLTGRTWIDAVHQVRLREIVPVAHMEIDWSHRRQSRPTTFAGAESFRRNDIILWNARKSQRKYWRYFQCVAGSFVAQKMRIDQINDIRFLVF